MGEKTTIGFPRMMEEQGERRVFLPEFMHHISQLGAGVYLEQDYGSRSGLSFDDYQERDEFLRSCSREEAFQKDFVIVLRSPTLAEFELLKPGGCLISMLHFPTRPKRVEALMKLGVNAISMDSITNDNNIRMVENMKSVSWNGLEAAFDVLSERWPRLLRPDGEPIQVLILGTGMVGKHAVDAATKMGNVERNNQHIKDEGNGVIAIAIGRNLAYKPSSIEKLFRQTDILVDATQRRNPSNPVVPNAWIEWLPKHSIVTDLAVDPYTLDTDPPVVRGIEGIPKGNLDQYVFAPDDPNWGNTIPTSISSENRRTTVSCYSWPGIHPEASMMHYGQQLSPFMGILISKGHQNINLKGGYFERALYRGSLLAFIKSGDYESRHRESGISNSAKLNPN